METILHCTNYDEQLLAALPHLVNYPQLKPFIGSSWLHQQARILFIGESHYLPKATKIKNDSDNWYAGSSIGFTGQELGNICTRDVIKDVETGKFNKAYTIFYNLKKAVSQVYPTYQSKSILFHNFGFYNYFQRPAEKTGGSINNSIVDNVIAYQTLKAMVAIAQPTVIIFVSKKAVKSFWSQNSKDEQYEFPKTYYVPHPACAWWHKPHKERYDSSEKTSGRERFVKIIKTLNLQINDIVTH